MFNFLFFRKALFLEFVLVQYGQRIVYLRMIIIAGAFSCSLCGFKARNDVVVVLMVLNELSGGLV